jgi:hypothetical protein
MHAALTTPRRPRPRERGNTLLLSMIVMAALALLASGAIVLSGAELRGANAKRDADSLAACARGGRELLMSQFKLSGSAPTAMTIKLPGTGEQLTVATAHYDTPDLTSPALTMTLRPASQAGTGTGPEDIANKIIGGAASQPATFVIVCEDRQKRRFELEFTIQFGF